MAKQKPINTSSTQSGSFDKSLIEDIDGHHQKPNQWTQARNAVNNTVVGDIGELSNEASNYLCTQAPYDIISAIHLGADEWAIYSTDDTDSEIGLFKEDTCSYETVVNDPCLNFNRKNLIKGVGRTTYDCGRQVYWSDSQRNPDRFLNLDNVPWVQNCQVQDGCNICTDTDRLDCDKIRLAPLIDDLAFRVERGNSSGQILNGSYYVVGAYLVNGVKVTNYSLPSNVQPLFTHQNAASSLDIFIEEADQTFDEFELILVQFANFNTVARRIGIYSTRQTKITLDSISENLPTIDPGELLIRNPVVDSSDAVYRNGEYLIRVGPSDKFDFNYQPLANQIRTRWVAVEYDADYYRNGGNNTGYMRDEIYSFFIRWVFDTGDKSNSYHLPGRISTLADTAPISGDDVITGDDPITWKVYNTATIDPAFPGIGSTLDDGGVILGGGDMGYWESSEIYDDDKPQIWNASSDPIWGSVNPAHDLCGKPIRHHKFPDNSTDVGSDMITNHYDPTDGTKIRIMGVQFDNIQPPLDNEGNSIPNVAGYEILRGSREGNKTVLAKGMINNMREYVSIDQASNKTYLYPNYPYNPTATDPNYGGGSIVVDHFLSSLSTQYKGPGLFESPENQLADVNWNAYLEDDAPLGSDQRYFPNGTNIKQDLVTFHSPETNFRNPFLSAKEIKVYGELHGTMVGRFQFPKDHPRHKFITNTSFFVSALIGVGYTMLQTEGQKSVSYHAPQTDFGGTYAQVGVSSGATGLFGPSAIAAAAQISANASAAGADAFANNALSHSMLSMLTSIAGVDPNTIRDSALNTSGALAGAVGGTGGKTVQSRDVSAWGATPDLLRTIQGIPSFLTYWGEGINKMLNIIYAFTPYRQYALQQVSHCFYDNFAAPDVGQRRRAIEHQQYLSPELHDFAGDYRVNNLYRSRTVALKLETDLALPYKQVDNTQALFSDVWDRQTDRLQWENDEYINSSFERPASSHYVAMKQRLDNQYGQIGGIIQVPVSTDATPIAEIRSPILFNGDVYIGRYTEKNTMFFFYDWLKGQPDGAEFDYRLRKMVTHPRFWMNTDPFDVGEFVQSLGTIFETNADAPADFDPFMETITNADDPNYSECECGSYTNCVFDQNDLERICELEEELYQLVLYKDFLEDCACFRDAGSDGCDGDDPTDTVLFPQYDPSTWLPAISGGPSGGCEGSYHPYDDITASCTACPTWNNAGDFIDDGKKKWARKIKRVDRMIRRAQRRLDRTKNKLYDEYLDGLDGEQEGFWGNLTDNINTPSDKFGFDMRTPRKFRLAIKEAFMYLFNSGIRDFFVETEINIDLRDWGDKGSERHYDHIEYTDLKELFSTDHIRVGNFYKYDYSLSISKLFNNYISWGNVQDIQYDPLIAETCHIYRPKRLIYSLPQAEEDKKDNWRLFLPLNYKDFNSRVTAIKPIAKNGAIILFENESPVQFVGVDQLQTDAGTKITIGDGGLFSQPLQNLVNADYPHEYGSCQSRLSVVNTPAGMFYISQNQGKIFQITGGGLDEISNRGLKWWFVKYLPYKLTEQFPDYLHTDNPVSGIGCQTIFDNENQIVFFCKKDWVVRDDIADTVTYNAEEDEFRVNGVLKVQLGDPAYFTPASWTMSYDPKTGGWIGYHDWHPDLVIPSKKTYMTTKGNGIWIHADRCDSYCNYYGVDYPFEVEFTLHTPAQVNTLRNIMYFMEVYRYGDNCDDRFHVLDFNFDEAIIYNTEQCSGLLRLNLKPKNNAPGILNYPQINAADIDILYSKEEQKYRFNQFWDITDDRGEFNPQAQRTIFITQPNGYIKDLNLNNLNYSKFALERKKFRHYKNTVLLRRRVSGSNNIIVSLAIQMNLNSPR